MKRPLDIFLVAILVALTMSTLYLFTQNLNLKRDLSVKRKQNVKLENLNRINSQIINKQDSSALLMDNVLKALKKQLKSINGKPDETNFTGFSLGDKSISATELLTIFNKTYKENQVNKQILEILKERFGITYSSNEKTIITSYDSTSVITKLLASEKEKINIVRELTQKINELDIKAKAFGLIQKHYNIPYLLEGNTISIPDNRIDTLLDIYPLIKNRIKYDKDKKTVKIRGLVL